MKFFLTSVLALVLAACDSAGDGQSAHRVTEMVETDMSRMQQLKSVEIAQALTGKLVSYSPPGWFDAGIHEEYHADGRWAGVRYSVGPIPFTGRWAVQGNQLCVTAERGLESPRWRKKSVCRKIWQDRQSKTLFMAHAMGTGEGLLMLSVSNLSTSN